jgi:hypothetical protein
VDADVQERADEGSEQRCYEDRRHALVARQTVDADVQERADEGAEDRSKHDGRHGSFVAV